MSILVDVNPIVLPVWRLTMMEICSSTFVAWWWREERVKCPTSIYRMKLLDLHISGGERLDFPTSLVRWGSQTRGVREVIRFLYRHTSSKGGRVSRPPHLGWRRDSASISRAEERTNLHISGWGGTQSLWLKRRRWLRFFWPLYFGGLGFSTSMTPMKLIYLYWPS